VKCYDIYINEGYAVMDLKGSGVGGCGLD